MGEMPDNPLLNKARCPRCGYDQRGVAESWADACPLMGTCSECGLEFEWAELLSPKIRPPRWCVEYGRWWAAPWRTVLTLGIALWPPAFWRLLKMTQIFRPKRVAAYLLVPFLALYVAIALSQGWAAHRQLSAILRGAGSSTSTHPGWAVAQAVVLPFSSKSPGTYSFQAGAAAKAFQFSPQLVQVNRATGVVTMRIPSPHQRIRTRFEWATNLSFWEVWPELLLGNRGIEGWRLHWQLLLLCFMLVTIHSLLCAVGFVLLPQSRRSARVKWSHIARITMYGFGFIVIMIVALGMTLAFRQTAIDTYAGMYTAARFLSLLLIPGMLVIWWSCATTHYLKIPHGWGVGVALSLIAYLLGPVLVFCAAIFIARVII